MNVLPAFFRNLVENHLLLAAADRGVAFSLSYASMFPTWLYPPFAALKTLVANQSSKTHEYEKQKKLG